MNRLAVAAFVFIGVFAPFVFAQDSIPKVQVFGGYSLLHENTVGLTASTMDFALYQPANTFALRTNLNGWSAEAQYNADRWIGVAVDFGGQFGGPITPLASGVSGVPNASSYSILAGPVLSYRKKSKVTPFAHALFGWSRNSLSGTTITSPSNSVTTSASNYSSFTMALGGGVDYKLTRHLSIRVGQAEWFHTSLNFNKFYGTAFSSNQFQRFSTHQDNLRFSTGLVVRF